jgi:hypothetical protein
MPGVVPPTDIIFVSVTPSVVSPAGPSMLTALALLASTVPDVVLIVPSALVATMPAALLVKMLTAPRP